ncbi:MAG TPA: DNA-formamidopyrimidine glycosylase family protein [Microthrixaceae bacterium]|nr:DNA-formamidopyrimidine glycosylase family protein [Microthrixaceae bacterium]
MPELPEVQAHVERLSRPVADGGFAGAILSGFTPITFTALKTALPAPTEAVGRPLARVDRRGKFLLLHFDGWDAATATTTTAAEAAAATSDLTFVVHLMQGGRLVPDAAQSARPRNGIARWTFDDGPALLLTEAGKERKAGVWVVAGDPLTQPPLDDLGIDADAVTRDQLATALRAKGTRLHTFLRDQHGIAGVGRMLANEICHRARMSPFASTNKLTDDQIDALLAAIDSCIADALAFERGLDRMSTSAERPGNVHHRKGDACPVCGDTVRAVEYNAYEVDYCPTCQTGGKVLADNTTSKFLK